MKAIRNRQSPKKTPTLSCTSLRFLLLLVISMTTTTTVVNAERICVAADNKKDNNNNHSYQCTDDPLLVAGAVNHKGEHTSRYNLGLAQRIDGTESEKKAIMDVLVRMDDYFIHEVLAHPDYAHVRNGNRWYVQYVSMSGFSFIVYDWQASSCTIVTECCCLCYRRIKATKSN